MPLANARKGSGRPPRLILNLLLVLVGILVGYLLLELVFFKPLLPRLPKSSFLHMTRELQVLGQSSFPGLLPRPGYIALAGDSHAQGKGDWFIDQGYNRTSRFHSAHLLEELTGRDVLSFGRSGAGSADGFFLEPLQTRAMLERLDLPLPEASVLLAYFYEGNDIENNLSFLYRYLLPPNATSVDLAALREPGGMEQALSALGDELATGHPRQWNDVPLCGNLLLRLLRNTLRNTFTRKYIDVEPIQPAGMVNKALIDGRTVDLPDLLQSPPLYMSRQQLEDGVRVMAASLDLVRQALAPTPVVLVYIPATLTCYTPAGGEVLTYYGGERLFRPETLTQGSDTLYDLVSTAAAGLGIPSIDTRPALREAARQAPIHGPRDWDHFNKLGY